MSGPLKERIAELVRQAERDQVSKTRHVPAIHSEPLGRQIDRWLAETPPAVLARPWTMAELQKLFTGRYRQSPHAQNVANELRKRGWYSCRIWTRPGYGKRIWYSQGFVNQENE